MNEKKNQEPKEEIKIDKTKVDEKAKKEDRNFPGWITILIAILAMVIAIIAISRSSKIDEKIIAAQVESVVQAKNYATKADISNLITKDDLKTAIENLQPKTGTEKKEKEEVEPKTETTEGELPSWYTPEVK